MDKASLRKLLGERLYFSFSEVYKYKNNPWLKTELARNNEFKNLYKGKRCFILGNGPSLNKLDFEVLRNEYVFTVNMLSKREDFYKLNSNFHIWADEKFFKLDISKPEDLEILHNMKKINTNGNRPVAFYKYNAHDMIKANKLDSELDIYYYGCFGIPDNIKRYLKSKIDFTKIVPGFSTVIHYAICLAVFMGFSEIILLGCDCTGFITIGNINLGRAEKSEYAYSISAKEKSWMENEKHHGSVREELATYVNLFDVYAELNKYCWRNGVALLNATEGSLLDSVTKIDMGAIIN